MPISNRTDVKSPEAISEAATVVAHQVVGIIIYSSSKSKLLYLVHDKKVVASKGPPLLLNLRQLSTNSTEGVVGIKAAAGENDSHTRHTTLEL